MILLISTSKKYMKQTALLKKRSTVRLLFFIRFFPIKNPHQRLQKCPGTARFIRKPFGCLMKNCVLKKPMLLRKTLAKHGRLCYNNPGRRLSGCIGVPRTRLCRSCHICRMTSRLFFYVIILYSRNDGLSTVFGIFIRKKFKN